MVSRTVRLLSIIAAIGLWGAALAPARAEGGDPAALAAAMKDATATLRSQPWRLVWRSTKKYPTTEQRSATGERTVATSKPPKSAHSGPTPTRRGSR